MSSWLNPYSSSFFEACLLLLFFLPLAFFLDLEAACFFLAAASASSSASACNQCGNHSSCMHKRSLAWRGRAHARAHAIEMRAPRVAARPNACGPSTCTHASMRSQPPRRAARAASPAPGARRA